MTQEEFEKEFKGVIDELLKGMAEHPEIDVRRFYSLTYLLENIVYFSPVIFGLIENKKP
ncbi:MAG: hypothetical protein M3421_15465 [Bacteroidota bacterium]|jgi:hypothetical protein|nr:hypothetical protein [Bacteroidota bacterium]